jgi:signal transduction histidine kinase
VLAELPAAYQEGPDRHAAPAIVFNPESGERPVDLSVTSLLSASWQAGAAAADVGAARERTRMALAGWEASDYTDLVELVLSEILTNALRHGDGPATIRLAYDPGRMIRVEVHDHGPGRPVFQHTTSEDESGRGLQLISGLVELNGGVWGVTDDASGPGKTVYVYLAVSAGGG